MKKEIWKKNIKRFLTAQTLSLFGSSLVQYAIVWYVTLSTTSGKMLMISTLCGFLPQVCISLFAGVWIDRYDRKKIIMLADGMIAIATFCLAITFISGNKNIVFLFLVLIIRSIGTGIQTPSVNAIIPQIVPKEALMKVNGINSTLSSIMMFLSPAVSGAILSFASLEITLFIDCITAVIAICITSFIKIGKAVISTEHKTSTFQEIKKGLVYIKDSKFIRNLLVFQMLIMFLISPSAFLTPLMVSRTFGAEVWRLTASEMAYSLGMVLGGVLITTWGGFKKKIMTTILASICYGCVMIGLGMAPLFIIYLCLNTLIGISAPCYNTPITVSIQENVQPEMYGRVFSLMQITTSCLLPLGMVLFGPLADRVSIQLILILSGAAVLVITICAWKLRLFENS